jgi:hypothetical protein
MTDPTDEEIEALRQATPVAQFEDWLGSAVGRIRGRQHALAAHFGLVEPEAIEEPNPEEAA